MRLIACLMRDITFFWTVPQTSTSLTKILVNSIFYYWSKKLTEGDLCEQTDSYTTAWGDNVNLTVHNGMFYTNVYGESEDFNITIPEYYETARIIEPRDAKTGEPFPLLGRITPAVGYMTAFQKDFFRITDSGDFFVAYEADDLIYVYDIINSTIPSGNQERI